MIHKFRDSTKKQANDEDVLYPDYTDQCISNIPGTILNLLDVKSQLPRLPIEIEGASKVVLVVLDGFGYNQFLRYCNELAFLSQLAEKGEVYPLTSVFPSQTTNALTTLNTGLTPQQHGLFEYFLYLKEADTIINTLTFEPMGTKRRNVLIDRGLNPKIMFNGETIYGTLNKAGIKTYTHIFTSYAYSQCAKLLFNGSTIVASLRSSDLIVNLRKNLEKHAGPAYFLVHLSNLDTIAHQYGPSSYEYSTELSVISGLLQKELIEKVNQKTAKETQLLVISDHGGVDVVPEDTTYLNGFQNILTNLKQGKGGKQILSTGGPRDVFLHVKDEKLNETKDLLTKNIGSKAKVIEIKEAVEAGLFGQGKVCKEFVERAGNLLILPYRNETVWFEHFLDRQFNLLGQHGGLNEKEVLVPLAISTLDNLK